MSLSATVKAISLAVPAKQQAAHIMILWGLPVVAIPCW
jgi:hypothetical protein